MSDSHLSAAGVTPVATGPLLRRAPDNGGNGMRGAIFVTGAVTLWANSAGKSPQVPVTPAAIAASALVAHAAGSAIVHLHVRDPETGQASRDPALFAELVDRLPQQNIKVILNLTLGVGGE